MKQLDKSNLFNISGSTRYGLYSLLPGLCLQKPAPKAYLNWVLLDEEQFKLVEGNYGAVPIQPITGTQEKQLLQANGGNPIEMAKNGYLYVYVSNESKGNVYFDDIRVEHIRGPLTEETHYYPFGLTMAGISSKSADMTDNKYKYNGKEKQEKEFSDGSGLELYDFQSRNYDCQTGRWEVIDPHSQNYTSFSPYLYVGNNPLLLIDPDGKDWFYYAADGDTDPTWHWREGHEYHTGVKDDNGKEVVLQGTEAVVVFNGSRKEHLGTKDGKPGYIDGKGAKIADVTVYGPGGEDDLHHYKGYTMSSNPKKYGVVADGIYDANYDEKGKSGKLESHWTVNGRGPVPDIRGLDPYTGMSYVDGVFIHRSNLNGFAGDGISKGCLLILPADWDDFNSVMQGVNNFKVQIDRREVDEVVQGLLLNKKFQIRYAKFLSGEDPNSVTTPYKQ